MPNQWFQSWPPEIESIVDGPYCVTILTFSWSVDVDQKNEDRQITYAFFDIGTVTVMPRLEPSRDACGDDCYFKHTFTPIGDHKVGTLWPLGDLNWILDR